MRPSVLMAVPHVYLLRLVYGASRWLCKAKFRLGKTHPIGILSFHVLLVAGSQNLEISVSMYPGDTEFALANPAHSTPNDLPASVLALILRAGESAHHSSRTYKGE